ncbi:GNAT family N-acetyltransferase [Facklamia lactis]|uniref:GNAT family N-acetyltransferase n=1 Tax=Facklamia lactis TaxID=2749967 RepID=UPI0018CC8371|nr:GNAT family N-acetyltransferase [Facklamia lactis]MBG9980360.1 GNAT family N-acetyltransferase [Facklamia lactis]
MELIRPNEKYLFSYAEALAEDLTHRLNENTMFDDPESVIERVKFFETSQNLPAGYVNQTTFWLVSDSLFIGHIKIRHRLISALLKYGGHVGYQIRYSEWGKGYGTRMLSLALDYCRAVLHLKSVLITCDDDNLASAHVIENNGGILQDKLMNEEQGKNVLIRRYWIDLD